MDKTQEEEARNSVARWLVAYVLDPGPFERLGTDLILWDEGQLQVRYKAIADNWTLYVERPYAGRSAISRALAWYAPRRKHLRSPRGYYRVVDLFELCSWAEEIGICTAEEFQAALEANRRRGGVL